MLRCGPLPYLVAPHESRFRRAPRAISTAQSDVASAEQELAAAQVTLADARATASSLPTSSATLPSTTTTTLVPAGTITRVQQAEADLATASGGDHRHDPVG